MTGTIAHTMDEHVVVVGAGPAGLAAAWAIRRAGLDPLVVEQADAVAASWRGRHDHLRLNTHRMFSHQPGARIPHRFGSYPARDDYVAYLQEYTAGMRLRLGTRVHRIDRTDGGWALALKVGSLTAEHAVIATGSDAEPVLPSWPGLDSFGGTVIHAGQFRNVAEMAGRDLPVRWQDATARAAQRLAFGDLSRFGYPRPALGPFTRQRTDGVTIAVDDGFAGALKTGRVVMKPGIDRFDGPLVRFTDGSSCAPDVVICATGYRPGIEALAGHLVRLDRRGMPAFIGAVSSPVHPGLWFFGLDSSIYGNMHVHRRQARPAGPRHRATAGRLTIRLARAQWPDMPPSTASVTPAM